MADFVKNLKTYSYQVKRFGFVYYYSVKAFSLSHAKNLASYRWRNYDNVKVIMSSFRVDKIWSMLNTYHY